MRAVRLANPKSITISELVVGDCFGELAIVDAPASYRSATVTTMGPTELLKLSQSSVHRLLSSEKCKEALAVDAGVYDQRAKLRSSKLVDHEVRRLWDVMVSESMRLEAGTLAHRKEAKREGGAGRWRRLRNATRLSLQKVTRPGYTEMHLRISKFLRASFGLEMAISIAQTDWAEDITAYSGDSVVDIWLEELKKKLRDQTANTVALLGWKKLFQRYDDDSSGLIELKEFCAAVRNDMRLGDDVISMHELGQLFAQADADGGGSLTSEEFATWVLDTATTGDSSPREVQAKTLIQDASRAIVTQIGWDELFHTKDTDGGGTLGMGEFGAIVRGDCEIDETTLPEEELAQLFQAVDTDASGEIDAEEFGTFISSDPLAMDMTYDIFSESCFQLAQMWVAVASAEQYAKFLKAIFDGITTTKGRLRSIVRDDIDMSDEEAVKRASAASEGPSAELAFAGDYRLADLDDIVCVENDSGGLDIEGVDTLSHADTLVPRFVGDTGAKAKPTVNSKTCNDPTAHCFATTEGDSLGIKLRNNGPYSCAEEGLELALVNLESRAVHRTGRQRIVDVDAYIRSAKFNHVDSQTGYASLSYMNVTGRDWSHKRMKYFGKLSSLRSICGPHANANVRHPQCVL